MGKGYEEVNQRKKNLNLLYKTCNTKALIIKDMHVKMSYHFFGRDLKKDLKVKMTSVGKVWGKGTLIHC